jgi:hypothetical protein
MDLQQPDNSEFLQRVPGVHLNNSSLLNATTRSKLKKVSPSTAAKTNMDPFINEKNMLVIERRNSYDHQLNIKYNNNNMKNDHSRISSGKEKEEKKKGGYLYKMIVY